MAPQLQEAVKLVKSEKVKERQEGLQLFRDIFGNVSNLQALKVKTQKSDNRNWQIVTQALFSCVLVEKENCSRRKGDSIESAPAVALNRLKYASGTVRWLMERASPYLDRSVLTPITAHLTQLLNHRGELFHPIALDYLKAITAIISHEPHLLALDLEQWISISTVCFNIILRNKLSKPLDELDENFWYLLDNERSTLFASSESHKQTSLVEMEAMRCVELLLTSAAAPLLTSDDFGVRILVQLLRFFEMYPQETSSHLSAIIALNRLLMELELNRRSAVASSVRRIWTTMLSLWHSKNRTLKEQLVVTMRIFRAIHLTGMSISNETGTRDGLQRTAAFQNLIIEEPKSRWGIPPLSLPNVELLCGHEGNLNRSAYEYSCLQAGREFDEGHALSWGCLELGADIISDAITSPLQSPMPKIAPDEMPSLPTNTGATPSASLKRGRSRQPDGPSGTPVSQSPQHPRKRLKHTPILPTEEHIASLDAILGELSDESSRLSANRLWKIQLLLFLVLRHWIAIPEASRNRVCSVMQGLMSDDDTEIQSWSCIVLATAAHACAEAPGSPLTIEASKMWTHAWVLATRRIHLANTCRAASHLAAILLQANLVPRETLLADTQSILSELDLQGPTFAYESVCTFLVEALKLTSRDASLAALHFEEKALNWLLATWNPLKGTSHGALSTHTRMEEQDPADVVRLLAILSSLPHMPELARATPLLPDCVISTRVVYESETMIMRDFVERATVRPDAATHIGIPTTKLNDDERGVADQPMQVSHRRCVAFLEKSLQDFQREWSTNGLEGTSFNLQQGCTVQQVRRSIDIVAVALLYAGCLKLNHYACNSSLWSAAGGLLVAVSPVLYQTRWSPSDRAVILKPFETMLGLCAERPAGHLPAAVSLCAPGPYSGVRGDVHGTASSSSWKLNGKRASSIQSNQLLQHAWSSVALRPTVALLVEDLIDAFKVSAGGEVERSNAMEMDDGFGDTKSALPSLAHSSGSSDTAATSLIAMTTCVSICAAAACDLDTFRIRSDQSSPPVAEILVSIFLSSAPKLLEQAGTAVFEVFRARALCPIAQDADEMIQMIGEDLLASHEFGRSAAAHFVAFSFLECSMDLWLDDTCEANLVNHAAQLCGYLARNVFQKRHRLSWRCRTRLARFVESYITKQPSLEFWVPPSEPMIAKATPLEVIGKLHDDNDLRVRFNLPSVTQVFLTALDDQACRQMLFDTEAEDEASAHEMLFVYVLDRLKSDPKDHEGIITRILMLGNFLVASSHIREYVYCKLFDVSYVATSFTAQVTAMLASAAMALGHSTSSELFLSQVEGVAQTIAADDLQIAEIPWWVLGFTSRRACLESAFPAMASTLLVGGDGGGGGYHFDSLLKFVQREDAEMPLRETLAFVTAYFLASEQSETSSSSRSAPRGGELAARALSLVQSTYSAAAISSNVTSHLPDFLDTILAELLALMVDQPGRPLEQMLLNLTLADDTMTALLRQLLEPSKIVKGSRPHRRPAPRHTPLQVYHAMLTLEHKYPAIGRPETAFHVLQHMFARIERERCTNEQVRLVQSSKLYISIYASIIRKSGPVLQALLSGSSVLLQQLDLIDCILPIFGWSLQTAAELTKDKVNTISSLLRVAAVATRLAALEQHRRVGEKLHQWLFSIVRLLLTQDAIADDVSCALQLWPCPLPVDISSTLPPFTLPSLVSTMREAPQAPLNAEVMQRFRAVLSRGGAEARKQFLDGTMWELLRRCQNYADISLSARAATAAGLAELLYMCDGRVITPSPATLQSLVASETLEYRTDAIDPSSDLAIAGIKEALLVHLAAIVGGADLEVSHLVLLQLRAILALFPLLNRASRMPSSLDMIAEYPSQPSVHRERSWSALTESASTVRMAESFDIWVTFLSTYACDKVASWESGDSFFAQIRPIVSAHQSQASTMLPILVHTLLIYGLEFQDEQCAKALSTFFTQCLDHRSADIRVWSTIIEVFLYLRKQALPGSSIPTDSDIWLRIDFQTLARRAISCSLFTSALLFVELANEHAEEHTADYANESQLSTLLYEIYSNVDDPDGFYAIQNPDLRASLVHRLQHEGEWSRAFEMRAAEMEGSTHDRRLGAERTGQDLPAPIHQALHRMGFNQLALRMGGVLGNKADDTSYDIAWRTGTWDLAPPRSPQPGTCQSLYAALRATHRDLDPLSVDNKIVQAFSLELNGFKVGIYEVTSSMRRVIRELLSLREVANWSTQVKEIGTPEAISRARALWPLLSNDFEFDDLERILAVRQSLVQSERLRHMVDQIGDQMNSATYEALLLERSIMVHLSTAARKNDRLQTSTRSVMLALQLDRLIGDDVSTDVSATEEYANVLWAQGEHSMALQALATLLKGKTKGSTRSTSAEVDTHAALLLAKMGQWRATARSDQPRVIESEYFMRAYVLMKKKAPTRERGEVCRQYAAFADEQYRSLSASPEFDRLKSFVAHHEAEVRQHQARDGYQHHPSRHHKKALAALKRDSEKLSDLDNSRQLFLQRSAQMYAQVLIESEDYDDVVIRFMSVWFENANSDSLNKLLDRYFDKIPSHKFLVLTHQLSSRLNAVDNQSASSSKSRSTSPSPSFQRIIDSLLYRMCSDHPFHTLYSIFALSNASEVRDNRKSGDLSSRALRASGAQQIWLRLRNTSRLTKRVIAVEKLCKACVEWAEVDLKKAGAAALAGGSAAQIFGKVKAIHKLKDEGVPVITAPLPIDPTCEYRTFIAIKSYEDKFSVAGGLHTPKITACLGSDGRLYKQLFKSADDLRQDAIFQQVFRLVNDLFRHDRRTAQRHLEVCTYLVIPLGPQCGLMEFVGNTDALGNVLRSLHAAFDAPGTPDLAYARNVMARAVKEGRSDAERIKAYVDVCARIPPVLRHFFTVNFRLPTAWFVTRLNYVRSNAVASMVGHMLGLGDRHNSNILLDTSDGRAIHIDFGIAFEQGRALQIPELVPFRLTREVVNGMGPFGVEGTFRRCCEESLRVLREGKDVIKTVLEVLKHDPIFEWSSNPIKILQAQGAEEEVDADHSAAMIGMDTASLQAEQALNIVMDKLSATLSVEYTVNELIQQAMDERHLGLIFCGWQPFY